MEQSKILPAPSLLGSMRQLFTLLPARQRKLIGRMLGLQIITAGSEILSLGAVLPFLGALANAPELIEQDAIQPWIESLNIKTTQQLVLVMAVLFASTIVLSNALRLLSIRMQYRYSAEIGNIISAEVYRRTLYQPYSFHTQNSSSQIISLSTADCANVSNGLIPSAFYFATNFLVVISIAITLITINPWIAMGLGSVIGGAYLLIILKTRESLQRNGKRISELNALSVKAIQEGLGGIRDVLIDGTQPVFESAYRKANRDILLIQSKNSFIAMSPRFLVEPIAICAISALAVTMALDSAQLQLVLPLLGALALGANRLLPALQQCFVSLANVRSFQSSLTKVNQALCKPINPELLVPIIKNLELKKELCLEDVWFRHPSTTNSWVLKGINISIKANTTVAFIGTTGSGKSTMADLILGLLLPQRGRITVDGKDLTGKQLRAWQASIAHVPQQIYLSDGTIAENIAFGIPTDQIDMTRVQQAAKLAHISDFIEERPLAYHEMVGERGVRLSGGQRQRIGIARALYKQASVIVFDEATSALDNTTEKEVMEAIEELSHHLTIILIAHRLSTIKNADAVFELNSGHIQLKKK